MMLLLILRSCRVWICDSHWYCNHQRQLTTSHFSVLSVLTQLAWDRACRLSVLKDFQTKVLKSLGPKAHPEVRAIIPGSCLNWRPVLHSLQGLERAGEGLGRWHGEWSVCYISTRTWIWVPEPCEKAGHEHPWNLSTGGMETGGTCWPSLLAEFQASECSWLRNLGGQIPNILCFPYAWHTHAVHLLCLSVSVSH